MFVLLCVCCGFFFFFVTFYKEEDEREYISIKKTILKTENLSRLKVSCQRFNTNIFQKVQLSFIYSFLKKNLV